MNATRGHLMPRTQQLPLALQTGHHMHRCLLRLRSTAAIMSKRGFSHEFKLNTRA
jgi:hypothetical protein